MQLLHEGTRYPLTDTLTRLEDEHPDVAYRLGLSGWRFQGTGDAQLSHMFVVRRSGHE